ncbi:hypothetical protein BMAPRL20_1419 [Burkholderia mallei PRL-20]|nr:hypothetical protein BMAPRL20_1419 [Burkholderia mallei PRL-20]
MRRAPRRPMMPAPGAAWRRQRRASAARRADPPFIAFAAAERKKPPFCAEAFSHS